MKDSITSAIGDHIRLQIAIDFMESDDSGLQELGKKLVKEIDERNRAILKD